MLKTVGLCAVAIGMFMFGVYRAQEKKTATAAKATLCRMLEDFSQKLLHGSESFPEIAQNAAKRGDYKQLMFVESIVPLLQLERSLSIAVEKAYSQSELPKLLSLQQSDAILYALLSVGSTDTNSAAELLKQEKESLYELIKKEQSSAATDSRMVITLYTLAGLGIATVLM